MFKKIALSVAGLAAAGVLPYMIATGPSHFGKLRQWVASTAGPNQPPAEIGADLAAPELLPAKQVPSVTESQPIQQLGEVMRFDVTPDWIMRRWPRVSCGLADVQMQGYRVPLVTGTSETDLAGSLTYYFNAQQRVQRITFAGTTGNVAGLLNLFSAYRLARRVTNDPGLMIFESLAADGKQASYARIRTAPVVRAGDSFRRYDVQLVLERPAA